MCASSNSLRNLFRSCPKTCLRQIPRRNLPPHKIRWQTFQPRSAKSQDKSSQDLHQRHAFCCCCSGYSPTGRTAILNEPILSSLQRLQLDNQSEEDKCPRAKKPYPPVITIDDYELDTVHQFTYLGSTITDNLSPNTDIDKRIGKASTTFARLSKHVQTSELEGRGFDSHQSQWNFSA